MNGLHSLLFLLKSLDNGSIWVVNMLVCVYVWVWAKKIPWLTTDSCLRKQSKVLIFVRMTTICKHLPWVEKATWTKIPTHSFVYQLHIVQWPLSFAHVQRDSVFTCDSKNGKPKMPNQPKHKTHFVYLTTCRTKIIQSESYGDGEWGKKTSAVCMNRKQLIYVILIFENTFAQWLTNVCKYKHAQRTEKQRGNDPKCDVRAK